MGTNWTPGLSQEGPRYRALADAIASEIEAGRLRPGAKLPPVRDLAWRLKVTPGTVARGYRLAVSRGLLQGEIGRGTFVAGAAAPDPIGAVVLAPQDISGDMLDGRSNRAPDVGQSAIIVDALQRLISGGGDVHFADYRRHGTDLAEREVGAAWLRAGGVPAEVDNLLLCCGAQPALSAALGATVSGADPIALAEPLIHPGLKDAARTLGIRLEPVEADADGLTPDALDAAAARFRPNALILSANVQNPSLATMPIARREAIAEIARRRRFQILEDDVYGWLAEPRAPSFLDFAPERSWLVVGLSKCVAAGLRGGFLLCPPGAADRAARVSQSLTQHAPWLVSALTAELLRSGDADRIRAMVRTETAARVGALEEALRPAARALRTDPAAPMAWLPLPEPWRASEFAVAAEAGGALIAPAEAFAVGRSWGGAWRRF